MTKRVAILISGGGSNMVKLVESMTGDHQGRPCVVVSNVPAAAGLDRAQQHGVPSEVVDHRPFKGDRPLFDRALQACLARYAPDVICLAGFMRVLTEGFVEHWRGRMLNIHPSLLPKYRGLNTHARAIDAGEREHGCTVHEVTPDLDGGPILAQARVPVLPDDTPHLLRARVLVQEHLLYPETLRVFLSADGDGVRKY